MAIQNRRGQYADFDPSKAVPGELLTVLSGDPNAKDGKAVYMTFASGDVKRMATYEDMVDNIEAATEDVAQDVAEQIEENLQPMVTTAQTAAQTATTKANEASQSASSVSASAAQIATNKNDISDLKSALDNVEGSLFDKLDSSSSYITNQYMMYSNPFHVVAYNNSINFRTFKFVPIDENVKELYITGKSGINNAETVLCTFYANLIGDPPAPLDYITQTNEVTYNYYKIDIPSGAKYFSVTFRITAEYYIELSTNINNRITALEEKTADKPYNVLVIGDSYSKNGQWITALQSNMNVANLVNLAVVNASVKDNYTDRETYPYTSRPVLSDLSGNHNTFMCQIEKLKRLMTGTDLDDGESKIYANASDYPNVIIIEGGQNDTADSSATVEQYKDQIIKNVSNVYVARSLGDTANLGSVNIRTPSGEVNRTTFAGAYRSLAEELWTLFPNAFIVVTSRSLLGYWNGTLFPRATDIYNQQRLCCQMLGLGFIDWQIGSQISPINNYPGGSGTQEDPYYYAYPDLEDGQVVGNKDSYDLLHPTIRGGKKYGQIVAHYIKQNYIDLS